MDINMWEVGPRCDSDCQCDGLIPESFRIQTARSGGKRRRERTNMSSATSPLARSPYLTPSQRTVLGRVENSPRRSTGKISRLIEDRRRFTAMDKENLPDNFQPFRKAAAKENQGKRSLSFLETELFHAETTRTEEFFRTETSRSEFRTETCTESRSFFRSVRTGGPAEASALGASPVGRGRTLRKMKTLSSWTLAQVSADSPDVPPRSVLEEDSSDSGYPPSGHKPAHPLALDESTLDFTHVLPPRGTQPEPLPPRTEETREKCETRVPGTELEAETEFETLHDLEEEFETDNFDRCTNYEIISTDSPNIISGGRSSRKITSRSLAFGAPIAETERSTSFNATRANASATRMLNFDDEPTFEFTSPATIRPKTNTGASVKKALKFSETPKENALRHERSDSSIGSMSNASPVSSHGRLRLFNSESTNSMESGFASEVEDAFLFDAVEPEFNSPKVANFSDLLSGQIKDKTLLPVTEETMDLDITEIAKTPSRPNFCRSLSLNPDATSIDKVRLSLFASSLDSPRSRGAKRPEPAAARADASKRRREDCVPDAAAPAAPAAAPRRPLLQRAMSENCASIMSALARSASNPDLIGDFSLPYALPLLSGHHRDLKSISCETLAALLAGAYRDTVHRYQVIDCRYPYEFEGGHIRGARNLYTPEHMSELLDAPPSPPASPTPTPTLTHTPTPTLTPTRSILVLHCEFSQERGPKLYRYLRSRDRAANKESYPSLRYPELYLLHGGYAEFVRAHAPLCAPAGYTPMQHPRHRAELARHRSRDERPPRQRCRSRLPL